MKYTIHLALAFILALGVNQAEAQTRKTRVVKGKRGTTVVVRKTNRKRIKRVKVVHHHYRHLPRRGATFTTVNARAITVRHGGVGFRFHEGVWYRPKGAKWVVTRPAVGIRVRTLPKGYRRFVVGPKIYYYYYGTYYAKSNNEYQVVDAPMGAEIDSLPDGYQTVTVEGETYYELDGTYYMPSRNEEGEEILVAVENPS